MNRYFTEVNVTNIGWQMGYPDKLVLIGSCFAENMGEKLAERKFQVGLNPFGILYNPVAVARSIRRLVDPVPYQLPDLIEHDGIWHSFDHHGRFSGTEPETVLQSINKQLHESHLFLKEASFLIITFGTALVFEWKATGQIVSNCHKIPAPFFKRFRLSPAEIIADYQELLSSLWKFNPNLRVLFTVSPIRHFKDGATQNQLSKSSLLLAADRLVDGFGSDRCAYFPAYEIMLDELRDYRFYAPDLVHPSQVAIDHIWEKFAKSMFSEETKQIEKEVMKIVRAGQHRVSHPGTKSHTGFLLYNLNEIARLTENFPFLNFTKEKNHFEGKWHERQEQRGKEIGY